MDVDCSSVTYETQPSPIVLEAVNKTLESLEGQIKTETNLRDTPNLENQTISSSPNAALDNSLLTFLDRDKASKEEIKEAFCRDIDTFSWEFVKPEIQSNSKSAENFFGKIMGIILINLNLPQKN